MALPPGSPDTFMREVDDAVRADRLQDFARNYGRLILAAIVVGLIALAGWLFSQSRSDEAAGALGTSLSSALDTMQQGRPKAAAAAADPLAKGDDPTYAALALMLQGNAAQAEGNLPAAAAKFGQVAAIQIIEPALRDAALLRQTLASFDTTPPATIVARLRPLVSTPGPAFASAAELTALAELRRGNDRAAGLLFKRIAETDGVADSLKSRAVQMAGMLGVDAVADTSTRAGPSRPAPTSTAGE